MSAYLKWASLASHWNSLPDLWEHAGMLPQPEENFNRDPHGLYQRVSSIDPDLAVRPATSLYM